MRVDGELEPWHLLPLVNSPPPRNLAGHLLELDDDKLAGLSGETPTTILTMPRLMSFCVVVSLSHFTKNGHRAAPCLETRPVRTDCA